MLDISLLDRRYQITCERPELETTLATLTSGFHQNPTRPVDVEADITADLQIRGLGPQTRCESTEQLAIGFEHALLHDALVASSCLPLHAAVVGIHDRITMLVGQSGVGKTTVTLGLLGRGCSFLSDEAAPIDPETGHVHPFPRCPAASQETMRLLNVDPEALRHIVLAGVFCISPESFSSVADSPHPVDDVVFMTRGETSHITPLTGQEGMTRLIQAASGESDRTQAFDTVGRIAKRAQFSEMTNGRLEDSLDILWGAIDR